MRFRRSFTLGCGMLLACAAAALAAEPAGDPAPKLAAMAPNTWLNLGYGWRGGHEVPACFDQANRLFFKYGGDGDGGDVFAYDPVHDLVIMPRGKET